MKSRYNLRIPSTTNKTTSSRVTKNSKHSHSNPLINQQNRRQSLRLTPIVKQTKSRLIIPETISKQDKVEDDNQNINSLINNDDDDYDDDLFARHHRLRLEEQKDRKLYERYIRDQRTLRRLQCRRTHTAHLNETTRNRLLRELERERRYAIHDKICTYLSQHEIVFQQQCNIESKESIDWLTLEQEICENKNIGTIHELDKMINNLKKVIRNSKSSISKPRLCVRERQKQRPTAITQLKSNISQLTETGSSTITSNSIINPPSQSSIISYSPRLPIVRFIDNQNNNIQMNNSQHLTCIQNVLLHHNNEQANNKITTNDISTPIVNRKSFLRSKSTHINLSDSLSTKTRPLEKENCSILTNTSNNNNIHSNNVLKTTSPMVSIKHTTSNSSSRSYPHTRKHRMINNSLTTRRQTRLSANI